MSMSITRERLQRLADERDTMNQQIESRRGLAEREQRDLNELEHEDVERMRSRIAELDDEIVILADDLERANASRDVSQLLRVNEQGPSVIEAGGANGPVVYRTFAAYARDQILSRFAPVLAQHGAIEGGIQTANTMREQALERLQRTLQNTTTAEVQGLVPPTHMAQIMDIINNSRPVVATARRVDLTRGKLTYPKIKQRPEVTKQGTEKTEAGTQNMQVDLDDITADTYLGGGNLSWQTINWSTPDALQLWFDLAAEAYARQTETAACDALEAAASGTASPSLGTAGTEDFAAWRAVTFSAVGSIYTTTGGRARTNTLYLAADQFFALASLGTNATLQMSAVGNLDVSSLTGTFNGLKVVGSYGFNPGTRILGDGSAFLVGETPGAPVEMRAVEPAIGGMEVGVIGAFKAKVYDDDRFLFLS